MHWPQIAIIFVLGFWLGALWMSKRRDGIQRVQFLHLTALVDQVLDKDQALYARGTGDKTGSLGELHPVEPTRRRVTILARGGHGGAPDSPEAA